MGTKEKTIGLNDKTQFDYKPIGNFESISSSEKGWKANIIRTSSDIESCNKFFLYLFPGQGGNEEWEKCAHIDKLMTYILSVKMHPNMTIVMPHIFYDSTKDKVYEAQTITDYLPDIVKVIEGDTAWESDDSYKRRAIAGLCLGSLCALKSSLYWERIKNGGKTKFYGVGLFSPAGNAEDSARWIGSKDAFKFKNPSNHRIYISCGTDDLQKYPHAIAYKNYFAACHSPINDFVTITNGVHDWLAFKTGFADFMTGPIFAPEFYVNL